MTHKSTVGSLVYSFFADHLQVQKGLSPASIRSYRDTLRLFLEHISKSNRRAITRLLLEDLTHQQVLEFLKSLEVNRKNSIRTRNHRLSGIHMFFQYLAGRVPELLAEAERVAAIPVKRVPPPATFFLDRDDIAKLFRRLPTISQNALRDRTLLLFLYNTGARVQEVADLQVVNLDLVAQRVHLHGKGDKWRTCPLWKETTNLLQKLLKEQPIEPNAPVFCSRTRKPLTRFGIYKIVRLHTQDLFQGTSEQKSISPHIFRHTTAVHLLESGVEVNVIRAWLGHVSIDTTNRYAEINIRTKEAALQACEAPLSSMAFPAKPIWRDDETLLKWLQSL